MRRFSRTWLFLFFAATLALAGCASQDLRKAPRPEDVGLSTPALQAYTEALRAKVDAGEIPGAVLLVARDGKVAWELALGWRDREAKVPMSTDSLFRMASMTKPVTAVAVLMLVDEGKIRLNDPLSKFIPEFAGVQVGVESVDAAGKPQLALEPAKAPIRIIDLLRHTSGLTYGIFGHSLVKSRYNAANLFDSNQTNAEFGAKIARLPLQWQPGSHWEYSMSFDVLGRVVEVASGMEFSEFLRARLFTPLRMDHTGFRVDAAQLPLLAQPQVNPATGKRPAMWEVEKSPRWAAGGHGLVSTADDYARLCQMLLNDGVLDGVRILSPQSARMLHTDVLQTPLPGPTPKVSISSPSVDNGNGFGLGVVVRTAQGGNDIPGSIGDYGWFGFYGTLFWIDPKQNMFAMLLVQVPSPANLPLRRAAREAVYRAVLK
ncbi:MULTISPECIES: serine hydrolase domain-containing protein [Ramlibacter]|uniref:Beta-lactamase family protein n=1 Tax=Ramlibacter aquaticus TaxID=2780094 RepID=A0ABR9SFJ1_9BURK|nr:MULTISPECIES: serine hydrolase domain-containing protein [Ramlibacter]MBE7941124.1 beta-lactamase family protein [Ramlibacter aquaticus]